MVSGNALVILVGQRGMDNNQTHDDDGDGGGDGGGGDGGDVNVGDSCEQFGYPGYIVECSGQYCVEESALGDGECTDYTDAGYPGVGFNCEYFDFDAGDCSGAMSENSSAPSIYLAQDRIMLEDFMNKMSSANNSSIINNLSRELEGYNIYRNGSFLASTEQTSYDDSSATVGVEYCYTVTAVYDTGESIQSNQDCATALAQPSSVELSLDDAVVTLGDSFTMSANMSNEDPVAGFQFMLSSDLASLVSVNTTARTEGFTISEANGMVVGFSLTGATIAPGNGAFLTLDLIAEDDGSESVCLDEIVLSDPSGQAMNASSSCGSLVITAEPVDPVVLNVGDGGASLNGSGEIAISMSNVDPVAGFQFDIDIDSSVASLLNAESTERTAGFNISVGGNTVLGFSLTGATISPGDGPILILSLSGDGAGESEVCLGNIVISDPSGQAMVSEDECGIFSVQDGPSASVQVIHNSADPTVDVYVDGALAVPSFEYRTATPVLTLPTSFTVGIAPAGGDVIAEFPFELEDGGSYAVIATGLLGNDDTPFGLAATATTFGASSAGVVGLEVYHGSTDAPAVDIWADDAPLLTDFSYGDFSGFVEVPAADYTLGVAPAGGDIIAAFTAPLSGLGGGSAVAFASGFLSGDDPAFGLFAALADGTVLALPALEQDCAGEWGGDAEVDACGECNGDATDPSTCLNHFVVDLDPTGVNQLVIFSDSITSLEAGDEIGIFDAEAITNSGDCSSTLGESLVGTGVWTGTQLEIVAIGSVDNCAFGGSQLPGWVDGNPLKIKVYRPSLHLEYGATATYSAGTGTFGDLFMAVSEIDLGEVLANDDVWLGPDSYTLNQNYPNPFNPSTDISFDAGVSGEISLVIYDILGNKVKTLVSGFMTPGNYVVSWDGTDNNGNNVSSGVYVYTLITSGQTISKRMLLVK